MMLPGIGRIVYWGRCDVYVNQRLKREIGVLFWRHPMVGGWVFQPLYLTKEHTLRRGSGLCFVLFSIYFVLHFLPTLGQTFHFNSWTAHKGAQTHAIDMILIFVILAPLFAKRSLLNKGPPCRRMTPRMIVIVQFHVDMLLPNGRQWIFILILK